MKVTADTITAEQIKGIHDRAAFEDGDARLERESRIALNDHGLHDRIRVAEARARCAAAWNARHGVKP